MTTCVICYEKKKLYLFPTCGKHEFCSECTNTWAEECKLHNGVWEFENVIIYTVTCPLCRDWGHFIDV